MEQTMYALIIPQAGGRGGREPPIRLSESWNKGGPLQ
jgi:hypothetical protein